MTTADQQVERAANKLQQLANDLAGEGGVMAKLAEPLAEDADFVRKLKPSLIKARAKGEAPRNQQPGKAPLSPTGPQFRKRRRRKNRGGPNPYLVVGAAVVAGIVLAKWLDWRGHAHPRD
jgi:hypothetical protein